MRCPTCDYPCSATDNYCRRCGVLLSASRLPVRRLNNLPVRWRPAPVALGSGLLALAVGTGLELLRRQVVRLLARSPSRLPSIPSSKAGSQDIGKHGDEAPYSLTETIILQRSWIKWARPRQQGRSRK